MQDFTKHVPITHKYCSICGNTGYTLTGEPCPKCKHTYIPVEQLVKVSFIPERYQSIELDKELIKYITDSYPSDLCNLQKSILQNRHLALNQFIASPVGSSKSILVYSTLQILKTDDEDIYPYFDIDEIRRIILDIDSKEKPVYLKGINVEPESIYTVSVLFVKVPPMLTNETFLTLQTLLDRRTRRNNGTIIISNISWKAFCYKDRFHIISNMSGDGRYNSIRIYEAFKQKEV